MARVSSDRVSPARVFSALGKLLLWSLGAAAVAVAAVRVLQSALE